MVQSDSPMEECPSGCKCFAVTSLACFYPSVLNYQMEIRKSALHIHHEVAGYILIALHKYDYFS